MDAINNVQTIAQAKAATPDLWHFLGALPFTQDAEIWYALCIGGFIGMVGHYIRGRASGDISGNPIDYFFRDNFWRSIGAAGAMASELFVEVSSSVFTTDAGIFVGWGIVLLSGLKSGYLGDSVINKGKRIEWTDQKREAAAVVKVAENVPPAKSSTVIDPSKEKT